ncbi:GNAT family N-acetyltransferase [Streptomyces sp. ACA25]|uniref:GNAT family N-acetyltransferase n=1 Tax=Streptomyces sp. ACA25 TaxID=3022596 RepID=UPI0023081991|nr:GNAT family N-acetyltransferase [Streptomyces sp. ACA25]MDB1086054.1 GNAT family N-acetyltransferase [Streptomyces sp. ACA25]
MSDEAGPWRIDAAPDPVVCARALAAAFAREPAVSWICGASAPVRSHWFEATLRAHATLPGARHRTLRHADGRPVAAAVLTPPGAAHTAPTRAVWAARTGFRCGPRALGRTLRYLHLAEAATPEGAWTLEFIGVLPGMTGRGAGRVLLDHLLADVPAPGGFYLTTADPANVPLYRHFGFVPVHRTALGPLDITAMARPGRLSE